MSMYRSDRARRRATRQRNLRILIIILVLIILTVITYIVITSLNNQTYAPLQPLVGDLFASLIVYRT